MISFLSTGTPPLLHALQEYGCKIRNVAGTCRNVNLYPDDDLQSETSGTDPVMLKREKDTNAI